MELNLRQFVPSRGCLSCDICCRFHERDSIWSPILIDEDIARLKKISISPEFLSENKRLKLQPYRDIFVCPLFDIEKNRCKIYASRPFDCQLYPFLLVKKEGKTFLGYDIKCPFIKNKQDSDKIKVFLRYIVDFLKRDDVKAMIKNNPQIIIDYKNDVIFLEELDFL